MNSASPISLCYAASSLDNSVQQRLVSIAKRRTTKRHTTSEKDPFATCVSRTRRSRRSQRDPKYWCTSCEEPFVEKYDWKRHEETYQERRFIFRCELCRAIYFLEKDFLYHHDIRHNCETCQKEGHIDSARQVRRSRTGWGCGFCTYFCTDWKERCNHVAYHFESGGKTMSNWLHSNVINSLLQRPEISEEWFKIMPPQTPLKSYRWDHHNTGRVDGYPESNESPHLQDLLEYYRPGDDAAVLAQLALDRIIYISCPSPFLKGDYEYCRDTNLSDLIEGTESWAEFGSTTLEGQNLLTGVCDSDFNMLNDTSIQYSAGF